MTLKNKKEIKPKGIINRFAHQSIRIDRKGEGKKERVGRRKEMRGRVTGRGSEIRKGGE